VNGVDIHFSSFAFVIIKTCCKDVTCVFVIFYELQHETVIFRFFFCSFWRSSAFHPLCSLVALYIHGRN